MDEPTTDTPPETDPTREPRPVGSYGIRAHVRGLEKAPTLEAITEVVSTALEGAFGGAFSVTAERID